MNVRMPAVILAGTLLVGACGAGDGLGSGTTTTTPTTLPTTTTSTTSTTVPPTDPPIAGCSAQELEMPADQEGLPPAVADTRRAILEAALDCDLEALAALATSGDWDFTYSFGGGDDPAGFWRSIEDQGQGVLADLVEHLALPYATKETQLVADDYTQIFVWPSAFADDPSDADWEAVKTIYTDDEIAQMVQFGGYIGYRIGITTDGEWLFLVAGD